jgi:glycine hydroxymethyltransferase
MQGGPFMHLILAKAVAFGEALQPAFHDYAAGIVKNAQALAGRLQQNGFSLVSGGTDNHLMLLDLRETDTTGRQAQVALESVRLVANKNLVPFDTRTSVHTSGLRIGTPAATTRGMGVKEMEHIGDWIARRLSAPDDPELERQLRSDVSQLAEKFPVPGVLQPQPV